MKVITVEKAGLLNDFTVWNVSASYADLFMKKCDVKGQRVALRPFFFNDTMHLTDPRQLLSSQAAYWIRAYREAEGHTEQVEALASVRALYYTAGALGVSPVTFAIAAWWNSAYELHGLPALNHSQSDVRNRRIAAARPEALTKH